MSNGRKNRLGIPHEQIADNYAAATEIATRRKYYSEFIFHPVKIIFVLHKEHVGLSSLLCLRVFILPFYLRLFQSIQIYLFHFNICRFSKFIPSSNGSFQ